LKIKRKRQTKNAGGIMTFKEYQRKHAPNEKRQDVLDLMEMTWAFAMAQNYAADVKPGDCNNLCMECGSGKIVCKCKKCGTTWDVII
jgi:hypothetical protein